MLTLRKSVPLAAVKEERMNNLKKLLAMFMLVCLMVGLMPTVAYASAQENDVCFDCTPADMTLTVDGSPVDAGGTGAARWKTAMSAGSHDWSASAPGHASRTGSFTVPVSGNHVDVTLPELYSVTFSLDPSGMSFSVFENGSPVTPSGGVYALDPDATHTYTATKDGFVPKTNESLTVSGSGEMPISLDQLFDVTFTCSPDDMTLTVPGGTLKSGGGTATRVYSMINGTGYSYSAGATNYADKSGSFDVAGATSVPVTLDRVYKVTFNGPANAVVTVSGGDLHAPQAVTLTNGTNFISLKTGTYSYTATCEHYQPITAGVELPVGTSDKAVTVTMTPIYYTVDFKDSDSASPLPAGTTLTVKNSGGTGVDPIAVGGSSYSLTAGNYTYDARRSGCEEKTGVPFAVSAAATIPVTLDPVYAVTFVPASSAPELTGSTVTVSKGGTVVDTKTSGYVFDLTSGGYTYTATRPGYAASGSFDVNGIRNVEVTLAACDPHIDSNSDGKCDNCAATIVATVNGTPYTTLAAAYNAAKPSGTIILLASPDGGDGSINIDQNVTIQTAPGKSVALGIVGVSSACTLSGFSATSIGITAGDPTLSSITTGAITVSGGSPQLNTVSASSLTASGSATPRLTGCSINTLTSSATGMVYVASGNYDSAGLGNFSIYGGTFKNYVDATKCKNGTTQYYANKVASTRYDITLLTPTISQVDNNGQFVMRSSTTLAFTTNIPGELKDDLRITGVTVPENSSSALTKTTDYTLTGATGSNMVLTLTNTYLRSIADAGSYTLTLAAFGAAPTKSFIVTPVANSQYIDADRINASGNTAITVSAPGATLSGAAVSKSNASGGTLSLTTSGGTVSFDHAAMAAIDANSSSDVTLMITKSADGKTFTLTLKDNAGADVSFTGGNATVTLDVGTTCPQYIDHAHGSPATTTRYYLSGATVTGDPASRFTYSSPNATLTVTGFSTITITPPAMSIAGNLPAAFEGTAYSATFTATGATSYTWASSSNPALPSAVTFNNTTGVLSGTPAAGTAGVYVLTLTVTDTANSANTATQNYNFTVTTAANIFRLEHFNGTSTVYTLHNTFTAAMAAAAAGDTISLLGNPTVADNGTTDLAGINKSVTIQGNGHTVGNISASANCTLLNLNTAATNTVTSTSPATVSIGSGNYGKLAGTGSFDIYGGTYAQSVDLIDCRRNTATTPIEQYYSYYSSANRWTVAKLVPAITDATNSAYYMRRSPNTIAFTTNFPYALTNGGKVGVANGSDIASIYVPQHSASALSSSNYTIYTNSSGNTMVSLNNTYLRALLPGVYTLEVNTLEGTAYYNFRVGDSVRTGDSANMPLWLGLMGGSVLVLGGAAVFIMLKSKKKKASQELPPEPTDGEDRE